MSIPSPEQIAMTQRVERALLNEINLLAREGVPLACILTALGITAAELISTQAEAAAVAPWFQKQADLARHLQSDKSKSN